MDDRQLRQIKLFVDELPRMTGPFRIAVQSFISMFGSLASSFVFMGSMAIIEDKTTATLIISCS